MRIVNIHLLMLLCALLVSGSFLASAAISHELDPLLLTFLRFSLASLLFAPLIWFRYGLAVGLASLARYALISAVLVIFFWSMFLSLRYTSALNTSVIFTLVPGLSSIYAMVLNRERLGPTRLMALLLGGAGALLIIFRGDFTLLSAFAWNKGDLIFGAGCLFMALYTPLVRLLHRGEPMLQMAFWIMVTGTFWLALLAGPKVLELSWSAISPRVWWGIGYLAIFSTIISFFLTQYATLILGPTRVAAYSYLYPGFVLVLEFFFGGQWPGVEILPGLAIVLTAMLLVQRLDGNDP